jgi:GPH family glycoside/pentoside/hexuronide:cation symporter
VYVSANRSLRACVLAHSQEENEGKLSVWKKLGFAFGGPPNQLTHTLIGFQLNVFLLQIVRLQPRTVGAIVLLGRFWDGLMDPTVGTMTTRTRSPWGSLKPWLAGSIVPLALSYLSVWSVPPWYNDTERGLYVMVGYLMYQLCISM